MSDAGSQYSKLPGENAKNFIFTILVKMLDILSSMVKAELILDGRVSKRQVWPYFGSSKKKLAFALGVGVTFHSLKTPFNSYITLIIYEWTKSLGTPLLISVIICII